MSSSEDVSGQQAPPPYVSNAEVNPREATLIRQIQELGESALQIDGDFESVKNGLRKIDSDQETRASAAKFIPRWTDLQKRWDNLLWESRETATKAEAYIKNLTEVIIPMIEDIRDPDDLKECREELADFVQRKGYKKFTQKEEAAQQERPDNFEKLNDDVKAFRADFLESLPVSELDQINKNLAGVQSEVDTLDEVLQEKISSKENMFAPVLDKIQTCGNKLDGFADRARDIVFRPIFLLAIPIAFGIMARASRTYDNLLLRPDLSQGAGLAAKVGAVSADVAHSGLHRVKNRVISNYKEEAQPGKSKLAERRKSLEQQAQVLTDCKERMGAQALGMDEVRTKFEKFQFMGDILNPYLDIMNSDLNDILDSSSATKEAFLQRMQIVRANNEALIQALRQYALTFDRT